MGSLNRTVEQQLAQIRAALPATASVSNEQWAESIRAVKQQRASPEQVGLVLGSDLLVEREEIVAETALSIAMRRAGLVAPGLLSDLLAYPPDESPSEESLLRLRSAFGWKQLSVADLETYAISTGIEIGEVLRRRHDGIEVALILGDPMGMLLRRTVWLDHGAHWQPNPRIGALAEDHQVDQDCAFVLLSEGSTRCAVRLDKSGITEQIRSRPTWSLLELAELVDESVRDQDDGEGGGGWSDLVNKGQGVPVPAA